ncbi:MAG: metallophosphoesterase family protein [Gammaproteobacteria bacterium]|nr:metallophosphoesterase family protein [Gammaproteobacteria bacterium]
MKVAILSDTHGQLNDQLLARMHGVQHIVHAGDVGSTRVLEALRATTDRVLAVRGNNDVESKWQGALNALEALPEEAMLSLPGGVLQVVHGHRTRSARRRHEELRERFPDARMIVYGHSHRLCLDTARLPWVVNPGAAGRARTFGGASMLMLHVGDGAWRIEVVKSMLGTG